MGHGGDRPRRHVRGPAPLRRPRDRRRLRRVAGRRRDPRRPPPPCDPRGDGRGRRCGGARAARPRAGRDRRPAAIAAPPRLPPHLLARAPAAAPRDRRVDPRRRPATGGDHRHRPVGRGERAARRDRTAGRLRRPLHPHGRGRPQPGPQPRHPRVAPAAARADRRRHARRAGLALDDGRGRDGRRPARAHLRPRPPGSDGRRRRLRALDDRGRGARAARRTGWQGRGLHRQPRDPPRRVRRGRPLRRAARARHRVSGRGGLRPRLSAARGRLRDPLRAPRDRLPPRVAHVGRVRAPALGLRQGHGRLPRQAHRPRPRPLHAPPLPRRPLAARLARRPLRPLPLAAPDPRRRRLHRRPRHRRAAVPARHRAPARP